MNKEMDKWQKAHCLNRTNSSEGFPRGFILWVDGSYICSSDGLCDLISHKPSKYTMQLIRVNVQHEGIWTLYPLHDLELLPEFRYVSDIPVIDYGDIIHYY
jgi:hypothetical protein